MLDGLAEDRATVGTDSSADRGAKTEGRSACRPTTFPRLAELAPKR